MTQQSKLAIVLLNWRNDQQTLQLLSALRNWNCLTPAIVVVDNESTVASRAALGSLIGSATVLPNDSNRGYGGGNNLGIRWALEQRADYVLLLNSDALIAESAVSALLNRLETHPEITVIGPVLRDSCDDSNNCWIGGRNIAQYEMTRVAANVHNLATISDYPLHAVDYVPGTVLLARRSVFEAIGLLDEHYFFSGEVADLCKRLADMGGRACIDLEVSARHEQQHTSRHLRQTVYVYYSLRNRFLFIRKQYPSMWLWYFARWTLIGTWELAKCLILGRPSRARAIGLALLHGLSNRSGNQNFRFMDPENT